MKNSSNFNIKFILYRITAITLSTLIIFIIAEFILRTIPIPGIMMATFIYDPEINLCKFTPNTKYIRTNIRNERVVRAVNSEGFLDKNHSIDKPNGVYRIGFFGDSYVESIQVPLDKTFFRLIEDSLPEINVETLVFGQSGHGTVHSYLKSKKYSRYFDLDMIVYVFCENDLGDQIEGIRNSDALPYVELKNYRIEINDDLFSNYIKKRIFTDKLKKYFFYNNSILMQTIYSRLKMLQEYGINILDNESNSNMSSKGDITKPPNENDLPSSWNSNYKKQAILLGEAVISKWFEEVKLSGRKFVILYVPREIEWKKNDVDQDSWKYWLKTYCHNNRIDFIDPTKYFFEYDRIGKKIYDDHFSEDGHVAFAKSFIDWYKKLRLE